jgi:hypothetical protein
MEGDIVPTADGLKTRQVNEDEESKEELQFERRRLAAKY